MSQAVLLQLKSELTGVASEFVKNSFTDIKNNNQRSSYEDEKTVTSQLWTYCTMICRTSWAYTVNL